MSTWTRTHMSIDTRAVTHEQRHMSRLKGDTWALKNDTLALLNQFAQVVPECAHVSILWPLTGSLVMCQCSRWHVSTLVTVLTCFFYDVMLGCSGPQKRPFVICHFGHEPNRCRHFWTPSIALIGTTWHASYSQHVCLFWSGLIIESEMKKK